MVSFVALWIEGLAHATGSAGMPIASEMLAQLVVQRHVIGLDVRGGMSGVDAKGHYQLFDGCAAIRRYAYRPTACLPGRMSSAAAPADDAAPGPTAGRSVQKASRTDSATVLEICSATWSVRLHFDTVIGDMGSRPDTTAQQHLDRAPESAGGG
jgi:hypothetical protein